MRFSIFHLMERAPDSSYRRNEAEVAEQVQYAEELGYSRVWIAEHHFERSYGLCPSTLMYIVKLGQHVKRIRLGSLVVVLPLHHPLRVAEEAAFADLLIGGRLDLGLGAGYAPYEFAGYGVDLEKRREQFREGTEIVRRALSGERFSFRQFYQFDELETFPRPIQQSLPIWLTANSASTAAWVGSEGAPCVLSSSSLPLETTREVYGVYRRAYEAGGHGGAPYCMLNRHVYVADTDEQARHDAEEPTMAYIGRGQAIFREGKGVAPDAQSYERLKGDLFTHGNPDTCAENIALLQQEIGLDELVCKFKFRSLNHQQIMATMRRFAEEVMPRFQPSGVQPLYV